MKTFKKALPVVGALVWALLLLPFFLGAEAAPPATDDFTFECRCKCNRNVDVCDFNLNITSF